MELEDQVKRLRKHPSLALLCGNNEVLEGLKHWGWQRSYGYSDEEYREMLTGYDALFRQWIPQKLKVLVPDVAYIHGSPVSSNWGRPESFLTVSYTHLDVYKRQVADNQVKALRFILSGSHEDMLQLESEGRLEEWCHSTMQWLYTTFGKANVVAATLHADEETPHIHATVVPIVTGERRKAKQEAENGKRKYKTKKNKIRLCADDLLTPCLLYTSRCV